jgi:hypothetical protein
MSTPDQSSQYPQQPAAQAAQGYYQQGQQGYQQPTGAVAYPGYGTPKPSPIDGGIWGINLVSLAALLPLIGVIAMIVAVAGNGGKSYYVTSWLLVPGLISAAIFLAVQALGTKK